MKQKLFLLFALFSMSLLFSCRKSDSKPDSGPKVESVIVTNISPDRLTNGMQVTVTGKILVLIRQRLIFRWKIRKWLLQL